MISLRQGLYAATEPNNEMNREIKTHIVAGDTADQLTLHTTDEPGPGAAHHRYVIGGYAPQPEAWAPTVISFQNGPIKENGVNGLTQEVLLAVVQDRLESFQSGPFACDANARALEHIKEAQYQLQARTRERIARSVEGTNAK